MDKKRDNKKKSQTPEHLSKGRLALLLFFLTGDVIFAIAMIKLYLF